MKRAGKLTFDLIILVVLAMFVVLALGYNSKARLVPLTLGIPGFALMLAQFFLDLREKTTGESEIAPPTEGTVQEGRREASILGWIVGSVLALYLAGFVIGVPLFTFSFLKIRERFNWALSLGISLSLFLILRLGFIQILQQEFYKGLLGI